jgi:hypothetical protein
LFQARAGRPWRWTECWPYEARILAAKIATQAEGLLSVRSDIEKSGQSGNRKADQREEWVTSSQSVAERFDPSGRGGRGGARGSPHIHCPRRGAGPPALSFSAVVI